MNKTQVLRTTKDICTIGVLIALGVVFSAFLPIKIFSDIKIDLSYIVIVVICYLYGGIVGGFSAALIALFESLLFSSYGISISWICANLVIGFITGFTLKHYHFKFKVVVDISAIIIGCALGLLLLKTVIECNLYGIPFAVKIVKNAVAFGMDTVCMLIGYCCFLPRILKQIKRNHIKMLEEEEYRLSCQFPEQYEEE